MGIDTRSDTMRPFSLDDPRPPTPARTSVAVDGRVAEYVASVSKSNSPSSPNSRTDAATAPMSTAMTTPHHYFLSDGMCPPERCAWRLFVLSPGRHYMTFLSPQTRTDHQRRHLQVRVRQRGALRTHGLAFASNSKRARMRTCPKDRYCTGSPHHCVSACELCVCVCLRARALAFASRKRRLDDRFKIQGAADRCIVKPRTPRKGLRSRDGIRIWR